MPSVKAKKSHTRVGTKKKSPGTPVQRPDMNHAKKIRFTAAAQLSSTTAQREAFERASRHSLLFS